MRKQKLQKVSGQRFHCSERLQKSRPLRNDRSQKASSR
jgi:hypothetical protein